MSKNLIEELANEASRPDIDADTVSNAMLHFTLAEATLKVALARASKRSINGVEMEMVELPSMMAKTLLDLVEASRSALQAALSSNESDS